METDLSIYAQFGGLAVLTTLVFQVIKAKVIVTWRPISAIALGIFLALLGGWAMTSVDILSAFPVLVIQGIFAGLTAAGLYDNVKAALKTN